MAGLNPFPGLRPFEPDEDHLFFGRERQVDELLHRLRSTRLVSVVGASGMGKSSLVRCGLIPSLQSGLMAQAGSSWRVAILRPGEDPIGALAAALDQPGALGVEGELQSTNRVLLEATLRRGTGGLIEAVRMSSLPAGDNLLIVVDQFEELFRFRRSGAAAQSRDESALFVKLLLEAGRERSLPIYSVITMRSDFIGDCMEFAELSEAVSAGQYLVPRLTRDELRLAMTGPVAVAGGEIAPRLVTRLLNEVGDDADQLPVLQHLLMRIWERASGTGGGVLDIEQYEAVGGMRDALSLHAEEAYREAAEATSAELVAKIFKALTDTISDPRGVRRPTTVEELAAISEASEESVTEVVEAFRGAGRSFLMPPAGTPLRAGSMVDISHESLMRCWKRLITWSEEERAAAETYKRIAQAGGWFYEGTGGLWRDPELELGLRWRSQNSPTEAWGRRYDQNFAQAMAFLERSEQERSRSAAELERARKRKLQQAWWIAGALGGLLVACVIFAFFAVSERNRAELNLQTATRAVDEMLGSAGSKSGRVAAEVPEVQAFRRELLSKAAAFYAEFLKQKPGSETMRREMAVAHFRLGDIHRLAEEDERETKGAMQEYTQAAGAFIALAQKHPQDLGDLERGANSYNWLGETERVTGKADAERAYDAALAIQQQLHAARPQNRTYTQELARSYYNRGILRASTGNTTGADGDYTEAIALLQPLSSFGVDYRQELDRVFNNRANLLSRLGRSAEAEALYAQAIASHKELVTSFSGNRDYELELAEFSENLAILYSETGRRDLAEQFWRESEKQTQELARRAPSVDVRLAKSRLVHGTILEAGGKSAEAAADYLRAVQLLQAIKAGNAGATTVEYHRTYGEALDRLAGFRLAKNEPFAVLPLMKNAVEQNRMAGNKMAVAWDYVYLCGAQLDSGMMSDANKSLDELRILLPQITGPDKSSLTANVKAISERISAAKSAGHSQER